MINNLKIRSKKQPILIISKTFDSEKNIFIKAKKDSKEYIFTFKQLNEIFRLFKIRKLKCEDGYSKVIWSYYFPKNKNVMPISEYKLKQLEKEAQVIFASF